MTLIIATGRIVDGQGSLSESMKVLALAQKKQLRVTTLEIVTLAKRWEDKLSPHEFKSGASAMAAIEKARKLLKSKRADLVVIKGSDFLKTGYTKPERENFMKLYENTLTPLDGYERLVPLFLKHHKVTESEYFAARDALFENYQKTFSRNHPQGRLPDSRWFQPLTHYFRGVDCANPNVDFVGEIILAEKKIADVLKISQKKRIIIKGNSFTKLKVDGLESLSQIAPYLHLKRTIDKAVKESKINFQHEFKRGRAFLDVYSCYPVVPMGLLIRLGLVKEVHEIPVFLRSREVTVTGGLNLGKAAWNLTSLNALIELAELLIKTKTIKIGMVHGNGSLGNQQGITILSKPS